MNLCIIPARSGSLRLKNKNIKIFKKKPAIYYPIKTAIKSKIFDKVMVSTNSEKIKKISILAGADVPYLRSKKLSNSKAIIIDVIKDVIKYYEKKKINFNNICCIYPTSLFLDKKIIKSSYSKFKKSKQKYLVSAHKFESFIEKGFKVKNDKIVPIFKKYKNKNSNNIASSYYDAGQFLWGKSKAFKKRENIFSNNGSIYLLDNPKYIDINTLDDWKKAIRNSKIFK